MDLLRVIFFHCKQNAKVISFHLAIELPDGERELSQRERESNQKVSDILR